MPGWALTLPPSELILYLLCFTMWEVSGSSSALLWGEGSKLIQCCLRLDESKH